MDKKEKEKSIFQTRLKEIEADDRDRAGFHIKLFFGSLAFLIGAITFDFSKINSTWNLTECMNAKGIAILTIFIFMVFNSIMNYSEIKGIHKQYKELSDTIKNDKLLEMYKEERGLWYCVKKLIRGL